MAPGRLLDLIHADIDGELDAAGREQLAQGLRADPAAATLHAELSHVASLLDRMAPPDAGPGLQARLLAVLPHAAPEPAIATQPVARRQGWLRWPSRRRAGPSWSTNLFGAGPYTSHPRSTEHGSASETPVHAVPTPYHRGKTEMSKNRIYALAALAAGIGAVGYFGFHSPPANDQVFGTIAPAQRYQAPTVGAADVHLGDQGAAKFMQSDAFRLIQGDAKLSEALRSDSFRAALQSDSFRAALASDSFRAALASDSFRAAMASDSFRAALASDSFRAAMASDAFRAAMASDAFRAALASDSFRAALASDSFRAAMQTDAFRAAMASDAFRAAMASDSFRAALASDSFRAAMASDSFRAALASDSFRAALASDSFRAALASDSFRAALASDSFRAALQSDSFRAALASDSFRAALASDSFRAALQSDSFRAAMASDSFRAALASDAGRAARLTQ
jgi:hypothetical protein